MASKKNHLHVSIEIDADIGKPSDLDRRADLLARVAHSMTELCSAAEKLLDGTGIHDDRARSYWLGHLRNMLDRQANDGCDGIFGTVNDMGEEDED